MQKVIMLLFVCVACVPSESHVDPVAIWQAVCPGNPEATYCFEFADRTIASLTLVEKGTGYFRSGALTLGVTYTDGEGEKIVDFCPVEEKPFGNIRIPLEGGVARFRFDRLWGGPVTAPVEVKASAFLPENIPHGITDPMEPGPSGQWFDADYESPPQYDDPGLTFRRHDELFLMEFHPYLEAAPFEKAPVDDAERSWRCDAIWGKYEPRKRLVEFAPIPGDYNMGITVTTFNLQFSSDFSTAVLNAIGLDQGSETWQKIRMRRGTD